MVEATKSLLKASTHPVVSFSFLFSWSSKRRKDSISDYPPPIDFWWQRGALHFEDAEERKMRFSSVGGETPRSTGERKGNDNGNATEGIIEGMVENENVPLLLKPIIKNKNRAHTLTFFAILFLVAPAVALSRVGHPWLLLRVYKMHLKNMEILI